MERHFFLVKDSFWKPPDKSSTCIFTIQAFTVKNSRDGVAPNGDAARRHGAGQEGGDKYGFGHELRQAERQQLCDAFEKR